MKYNVLHNFISPITGRITCNYNYVPLGNSRGIAIPSPILIDIRLDIIKLRNELSELKNIEFVTITPSDLLPNAQALSNITPLPLGAQILKFSSNSIAFAIPEVDYLTENALTNITVNNTHPRGLVMTGDSTVPEATVTFTLDPSLQSIASFTTPGIIVVTSIGFSNTVNTVFLNAGTGISILNGDGTTGNPTISLSNVGTAGTYGYPSSITTNAQGQISNITAGTAPVSSVNITGSTGISISGSPITSSGTITLTLSSGLQDLSSYSSASFLQVANNLSDILNSSTARANLGLTNVATQAVTNNSILIGGASNSIVSQALTNGQILIGSTGVAPVATVPTNGTNISWTTGAGSLTANISGQIALSNGGTGISLTTAYGILCGGTTSTGNLQNAGTGSSGYFLGGNGASALPSWKTAVTSVAVTGSTGLTVSGSPITSTGTISLTLANELQYFSQLYPFSALYGGLIYRKANYPFAPSYTLMNFTVSGSGFNVSMSDSYYTFSLGTELQGLSGLSSTGIIVRTGGGTYATTTLTAGTGISVTNGSGVSGNPTIAVNNIPISSLINYPNTANYFLRGDGVWSSTIFGGMTVASGMLQVNSNSTSAVVPWGTWFAYFKLSGTSAVSGGYNLEGLPVAVKCLTGAVIATEFESISSIKKKNIISKYEEFKEELKEKFDTIDFVKYEWKDKLKDGFGEYYGYIAENVSKAFPELVNLKHTEYAPNILKYADLSHISGKNYRIIFSEDIEIKIGKKLKIISKNEKTFEAILKMKENNNSYLLSLLTDAHPVGEILVYGSYEEVPLVSKTRFHDMSAARLKILIDEVSNLSRRIDKIENVALNL